MDKKLLEFVYFEDRTKQFEEAAKIIEQKFIRRHGEKPGVSRRHENRPSSTFMALSSGLLALAKEMYIFRNTLEEKAPDYVFMTSISSEMNNEERDELDETIKLTLTQFSSLLNQISNRINNSDGLKHTSERVHLLRIHEGLQAYLKEIADFSACLKKEHLKRLQSKNRSLRDVVKRAEKEGYNFKYTKGIHEISKKSEFENDENFLNDFKELEKKHPFLNFDKIEKENQQIEPLNDIEWKENDDGWSNITEAKNLIEKVENVDENRLRRRKNITKNNPEREEAQNSYEKWRNERGVEFEQQFQQQAEIIREEFVSAERDDEIQRLEEQINEIQSLSSLFSEKIMDQEKNIDLINDLALHTTENLVDGNEWIRKAITNSALRRVILLFCIIVLTFTLLFLDWYNP